MNHHRFDIKDHADTPVAQHFSQPGHLPALAVAEATPTDTLQRRIVESQWITRFRDSPHHRALNRDNGVDILHLVANNT